MDWQEIAKNPKFQEMPYERRRRIAENYFKDQIANEGYLKLPPERQSKIFDNFLLTIGAPDSQLLQGGTVQQPDKMGFFERTGKSFGRAGLENLQLLGRAMQFSVNPVEALTKPITIPERVKPQVPPAEKLISKETLADIIGAGIADLPAMIVSGGVGSTLVKKLGLTGTKAFLAREALAGATFAQSREYDDPVDRLKGTAEESLAWVGFGLGGKVLGKVYQRTLKKLITKNIPAEQTELINASIQAANKALSEGNNKKLRSEIDALNRISKSFSNSKTWERLRQERRNISEGGKDVTERVKAIDNALSEVERTLQSPQGKEKLETQLQGQETFGEYQKLEREATQKALREQQKKLVPATVTKEPGVPPAPDYVATEVSTKPKQLTEGKKAEKIEPKTETFPTFKNENDLNRWYMKLSDTEQGKFAEHYQKEYDRLTEGARLVTPQELDKIQEAEGKAFEATQKVIETPKAATQKVEVPNSFNGNFTEFMGKIYGVTDPNIIKKEFSNNGSMFQEWEKLRFRKSEITENFNIENNVGIGKRDFSATIKIDGTPFQFDIRVKQKLGEKRKASLVFGTIKEKEGLNLDITNKGFKAIREIKDTLRKVLEEAKKRDITTIEFEPLEEAQNTFGERKARQRELLYLRMLREIGYDTKNIKTIKDITKLKPNMVARTFESDNIIFDINDNILKQVKPKRSVGKGKAATKVETPTEAVAEIVEGKRQSNIGTAEFKTKMLAELDKAIEKAPSHGMTEADFAKYKKGKFSIAKQEFDKITIEIPGDGKFTIVNVREELQRVKDKVKGLPLSDKTKTPKAPESITGKTRWEMKQEYLKKQELKKEEAKAAEISAKEPPPAKPAAKAKEPELTKPEVTAEAKPEKVAKPQTIEYFDKNQKTRIGKLVETKKNGDVLVEMADGTRVTVKAENVKQPKNLKEVTEKLSEKVESENIPDNALRIVPKGTKAKTKSKIPFDNPKIESEYQQSKGVKKQPLLFRAAEKLRIFRNKTTRGAFEHLPRTKEFSILRNALQNLGKQKEVSSDKSLRILNGIIVKIKKNLDSYDVFERKVLLDDLLQESKAKRKLPGEWTEKDIAKEHAKFSKLADSDPNIKQALADRKQLWEGLKNEYVAAMDAIGFNVKNRFTKEDYFRHQVLEYANARGLTGTGNRLRTPAGRGFLKARKGSKHSINTNYLEAEYEVMSQMLYDIERAKVIKTVDKHYNIANKIKAEAKKQGKIWEELIPETHDLWQPREGNVLFFTHTIPERMAQELLQGVAKDINISAKDVRKILAIGGPRKEFVLPKNVIEQLNNLVVSKDHNWFSQGAREILKGWKVWTLIAPRRFAKYNIRNITGDADASFVGNPTGFKKVPQAVKELYELFYKNKQPTGQLKDWYERGGMQQLLQIQEMGEIKDLQPFMNMYDKKLDLNIFKRYFRTARKATDFREAILRYANYLDYVEQMTKSGGKPKNFGASIPEEVMALPDIKDRAFKMQNDLLGAYDDISVTGQWLRESVYPFWSWKELNFRRYIRLFKNAANNDQLATSIGRSVLAKTPFMAMRIGKFVIKATGLWTMLQVYNNTLYPDEERDLPQGIKRQPHIILGRNEDGTVKYFSRLGALGDFLEWFGMEEAPYTITDWLNGKRTLKETVIDMAKKPVNIIAQGIRPEFKTSAELLTGQSFYPDILKPRTARDRGLLLARSLGLENEYIAIKGLPSKGYQKSLKLSAYYEIDPYQSAYMDLYDEKDRYIKKLKGESGGSYFSFSPRSNALYNFKLAIKYGDKEAAAKYFAEYVNFGGTGKGLSQSLRMMHPLYGLKKNKEVDEQTPFINSLDDEMKHKVELALKFYNEILLKDIGEYQDKLKDKKAKTIEWK